MWCLHRLSRSKFLSRGNDEPMTTTVPVSEREVFKVFIQCVPTLGSGLSHLRGDEVTDGSESRGLY